MTVQKKKKKMQNQSVGKRHILKEEHEVIYLREGDGVEGTPVVADCLIPEHALLPYLQQQPRVQVSNLAANTRILDQ